MSDGPCHSCGRAPGPYHVDIAIDGQVIGSSPCAWVYANREGGERVGMCDQCFSAGCLDGLSSDEIEYFHEEFARCAEDGGDA